MTKPRKLIVSLDQTPWYHCFCRAVRRGWLFGVDDVTGKDYSHRKEWVTDKLGELSHIFAIDVAAYAVMSNHYHLVLHMDKPKCEGWSDKVVIRRWMQLFKGHELTLKILKNKPLTEAEKWKAHELIAEWRSRLSDISWFMRCLNEHLAKKANAEDKCTGRFWEGRFKSQALLDEQAVITCMAYVDLNPVRAGKAALPETSDFTAIQQRIQCLSKSSKSAGNQPNIKLAKFCQPPKKNQLPAADSVHQGHRASGVIPFYWKDYLELIDWTGRAVLPNTRLHCIHATAGFAHPVRQKGAIALAEPKILKRLEIDIDAWLENMPRIEKDFHHCIGRGSSLQPCAEKLKQHWAKGLGAARRLFGS